MEKMEKKKEGRREEREVKRMETGEIDARKIYEGYRMGEEGRGSERRGEDGERMEEEVEYFMWKIAREMEVRTEVWEEGERRRVERVREMWGRLRGGEDKRGQKRMEEEGRGDVEDAMMRIGEAIAEKKRRFGELWAKVKEEEKLSEEEEKEYCELMGAGAHEELEPVECMIAEYAWRIYESRGGGR